MFRAYNNSQTTNPDLIVVHVRRIKVIEWALPDDKIHHTHIYSNISEYESNCALKMLKLVFTYIHYRKKYQYVGLPRVRLMDSRSF